MSVPMLRGPSVVSRLATGASAQRPPAACLEEPPAPVVVSPFGPGEEEDWDQFVRGHREATPFHLQAWKRVVSRSLGHHAHYLLARRGPRVVGVLPLFHLRSALFGSSLVSVPAAVAGGPLAEDQDVLRRLVGEACALAERLRVGYLELRSERPLELGLAEKDLYVTFRADLTLGEAELQRRMERKRRQMLACCERVGVSTRMAGGEELSRFYDLFCRSMRSHGTPVYSRRYLAAILREYGQEAHLFVAELGGEMVAATLGFDFNGTLLPFYAGTHRDRRLRGLDEHLYWSLMRWGIANGRRSFDFGRSKRGTGAHAFKARWGMPEVPLVYQYHLVRSREMPQVGPANPRYAPFIAAWRRLPLPLTRLLGPPLVRRVP